MLRILPASNSSVIALSPDLQSVLQVLVNLHDSSLITTAVAVIWCTENCHHISVLAPIVTLQEQGRMEISLQINSWEIRSKPHKGDVTYLHHQLMGTSNECQAVIMVKGLRNILSKGVSGTSW